MDKVEFVCLCVFGFVAQTATNASKSCDMCGLVYHLQNSQSMTIRLDGMYHLFARRCHIGAGHPSIGIKSICATEKVVLARLLYVDKSCDGRFAC